jgi:hypothetical protein
VDIAPIDQMDVSDDDLLDQIERAAFAFFWQNADLATGQIRDRCLAAGDDSRTVSSVASTGFGLTTLCIGDSRAYGNHDEIVARVRTTLDFLCNRMPHEHGFFYHFVDMSTGAREFQSEVSVIDTSIVLCGVLTCRAYFADPAIQTLATQIYERVNWPWMLNGGDTFAEDWTPESGFNPERWDQYSELMMMYLLALGSPTHPIPPSSWQAWRRPNLTYRGLTYIAGDPGLFTHQYSHAWFDFQNASDSFANYFQNSIAATIAHRDFCLSLAGRFPQYNSDLWGITASDSPHEYVAWGGPPEHGPIDGTIVPCATAGSLPFLFRDCIRVLQNIRRNYPRAWQRYGFVDAFNPITGWYDTDVVGIDVGTSVLMAENHRTGLVWRTFMKNPEAVKAMRLAGFHPD